ncbi:hypothetical protein [uncultured Desulfobacter sp.]|uniref:hypothetical protein n=1 Tax=uncultured Desulfobacter sp. TaxID=240139 RepID=UPI002AA9558A|nr:hypothetical protein [uncultured Desulfobacter sp.]
MAIPIAPTPVLKGKEVVDFQKRLDADLKRPAKFIETPKLGKGKELLKQYASRYKK